MYQSHTEGLRGKFGAGVAAGAIQLGIALGVLTAFTGGTITRLIHPAIPAPPNWNYVPPPPPPAAPDNRQSRAHQDEPIRTSSISPIDFPTPSVGLSPTPDIPATQPGNGDAIVAPDPQPTRQPPPSVGAHPLGNPGEWITPNDYPSRALREGWSGVTRLHLTIGGNGRVTSCQIAASSGHDSLDAVACAKVTQRGRFSPARDGTGALREGSYDSAIRWTIQEE